MVGGTSRQKGKVSENRQTICIIDDDASVCRALCRLIRSAGWNAVAFASAEDFLRAATSPAPDCLVLDAQLPGLSVLELQERLLADAWDIPIVLITCNVDEEVRDLALRTGAVAFLQKPFEEQCLLAAVVRALG
jgi:FixJ family two-component response regulator